ncbi:hypothetical protein A3E49_00680 [Candidatus Saccharibacteria bacterium RIFCSPHIGHO2_12_FULL_49_19]|nr:MAG: hypothetical protein A3E49_00680 [Candidatus Saccharibacteria bacterium RIFCSPHIGHO2_12_FULL_49_19]OGL37680.1 MAG: hypothetical protein A3B63_03700 [Candidatus Saccharibacteria bacterium RIFCSPLOWO2_01_FULL_49_22]
MAQTDLAKIENINLPDFSVPGPEYYGFGRDHNTRLFLYLHDALQSPEGARIKEILGKDSRVQALVSSALVSTGGGGGSKPELDTLAMWFIYYASIKGIPEAVKSLEAYLAASKIEYTAAAWVTGIEADQKVELVESVELVPIGLMPPSSDKEYFEEIEFSFHGNRTVKPRAALTLRGQTPKIFSSTPSQANGERLGLVFGLLADSALVLNLIPGLSCLHGFTTSYLDDSVPMGPLGGRGGSIPNYDVSSVSKMTKVTPELLGENDYAALLNAYRKLTGEDRERWALIISRLGQAKRRFELADKILDLGIAMEMAIISSASHREQLSLTFRLRGSRLLAEDFTERKKIHDELKDIYEYRSAVAHNGVIARKDRSKLERNIQRYEELGSMVCSQLLLQHGRIDWDELLLD